MTRRVRDVRGSQYWMGGPRNVARAGTMRTAGLSDRAIARALGLPVGTVSRWFHRQDWVMRRLGDRAA